MKILAIDDDEGVLCVVEQSLTHSGYHQVTTATSGKRALEFITQANQPFDCFLIDIQMPEMNGVNLTRAIRQTPGYENTPIIMLTAMTQKSYLDSAFEAGATDYVTKPFELKELRQRLQVAQKVAQEKQRNGDQKLMKDEPKDLEGRPRTIPLTHPIQISDIDSAIDYHEFDNYVLQLSCRWLFRATVVAMKLGDVDRIFERSSSAEFESLIRDIAKAAKETLVNERGVLSYRGKGTFLCVNERPLRFATRIHEDQVNDKLAELRHQTADTPIKLLIGDQVRMKTGGEMKALESLALAVESVENRFVTHQGILAASKPTLKPQQFSEEQQRLEKRAYEVVLNKALSESESDNWQRKLLQRQKERHISWKLG